MRTYAAKKERRTLAHIVSFTEQRGHAPTQVEIAKRMNVTKQMIWTRVRNLERKGYVTFEYDTSRSLRVTEAGRMEL